MADNKVNLDEVSNIDDNKSDQGNLDDFFEAIEKQVNGAVFDDVTEIKEDSKKQVSKPEVEVSEAKELDNIRKRYDASSKEAKKLHSELQKYKEYENYLPLLEAMKQDPDLVQTVSNYLNGNSPSQSVKDTLGLPEDFVFDVDEVLSNPKSESAKVFNHLVERIVQSKIEDRLSQEKTISDRERSILDFQRDANLSDEEMDELLEYAKSHKLSMEDIYYLKNRKNRDQVIAQQALTEREKQREKMTAVPASLASSGETSQEKEKTEDEKIFEAIKSVASSQDYFS